jgi:Zn-dependent protease with chaperone function
VCAQAQASDNSEQYAEMCSSADEVTLVEHASWALAGIGFGILVLIYGGRVFSGTSRARLSMAFGIVVRGVMLLLSISILGQAALLVFSIYTLESMAIHRVHSFVLGGIGLGAAVACWQLLRSTFEFLKKQPMLVKAMRLRREDQPQLFEFVDAISFQLGAKSPANIIVGLEPNFFVTSVPVTLLGTKDLLQDETLFISLGMMRLLDKREFSGVVGHELGHFRGDDTEYSKRFAPAYARLGKAWVEMSRESGGMADIARIPAIVAIGACWSVFASAERAIGRDREILADCAGSEVSGASSLAQALVKFSSFAHQWHVLMTAHINDLAEGRTFENLSTTFRDGCRLLHSSLDWDDARLKLGETTQAHPVDTHPPLAQRLDRLGTSLSEISPDDIAIPEESAITLIQDPESLEKWLTRLEANWLVAIGAVVVPPEEALKRPPESEDTVTVLNR